ncbi:hypothetical protein BGW38_006154 [Lunasporangiospora selenospora]|uniref:Uncharacterized protein n=1 Tax=Lunasporangiospora selenospora TaxID=979761 RepID=A0A9P6FZ64_9FUNG|nr:hypothetical protein BGW38_006154 [Lunasporangiospora selenospora]
MRFSLITALAALASTAFASYEICLLFEPSGNGLITITVDLHATNTPYLLQARNGFVQSSGPYRLSNSRGWIDVDKSRNFFHANFDGSAWGIQHFKKHKSSGGKTLKWACQASANDPGYCANPDSKWAGCQSTYLP